MSSSNNSNNAINNPRLDMLQDDLSGDEGLEALKALHDFVHSRMERELKELRASQEEITQLLKEAEDDRAILMRRLRATEGKLEHAENQLKEAMKKLEKKDEEMKAQQEHIQDLEVVCRKRGRGIL